MQVVLSVSEQKKATGKAVYDPEREKQVLDRVARMVQDARHRQSIRSVFEQIMASSRKVQYQNRAEFVDFGFEMTNALNIDEYTNIAYFGQPGSHTHAAAMEYFSGHGVLLPCMTMSEAIKSVVRHSADYAVLPIENSTTGGVNECYDTLSTYDVCIVGEITREINQSLIGLPGTDIAQIKTVFSHPQAILQTKEFFSQYEGITLVASESTSEAARKVSAGRDASQAAICAPIAAEIYDLSVLYPHIEDIKGNSTRFIVLSRNKQYLHTSTKCSIVFTLPHVTGSLYSMLSNLIFNDLNLTKIESRPIAGELFQYRFFVDFEGRLDQPDVISAIVGLFEEALSMKVLGCY
jgi:chorismate mutase/prephenate dehydratase